jgi:osmotically inducible lipoprotein OsmB
MRRGILPVVMPAMLSITIAGCGYSRGDRAVSGGLLGAGGGAAIGAVTGGSPLAGAAIGGAAGAIGGALTSGNTVNLGRPVWR